MRIRRGFVSNSSTTSFCIYGLQKSADIWEDIEAPVEEAGLTIEASNPNDYNRKIFIGLSLTDMKRDETRIQFEQRIADAVDKLFPGEGNQCGIHKDGYYDG